MGLRARAAHLVGGVGKSAWSVAESLAFPFMMFISTPLFLLLLGQEQFGQWMLVLTFNALGGVAGLGMGVAVIKEVSASRGAGGVETAVSAVRNCLSVTMLAAGSLASVLAIAGWFFGPDLLGQSGDQDTIRFIFLAAAVIITFEQIDSIYASTLRGLERFDLSAILEVSAKAVFVGAALVTAWLTSDLKLVVLATLATSVARTLCKAIVVSRLFAGHRMTPIWQQTEVRRIFDFGKWSWWQAVASAAFATGDRFMIAGLIGADALARYTICLQLAQQIQIIPAAAAQRLFPAVSRKVAAMEPVHAFALKATLVFGFLSVAIALPLMLFAEPILTLWVGREIAQSSSDILILLAAAFALLAINSAPHFILLGLHDARGVALINIVAGLLTPVVTYVAIVEAGLLGPAAGRIFFGIMICLILPLMYFRLRQASAALHGASDVRPV